MKQAYFDTLNEALRSEGLVEMWPTHQSINYDQTVRVIVPDPAGVAERLISITRMSNGLYERPIHYLT
jgi:hypothetical protein